MALRLTIGNLSALMYMYLGHNGRAGADTIALVWRLNMGY